jgi:hypothetical protein
MLFAAAAGLLFITTACTKVELKMGVKVDLSKLPVNAMQLTLPNGPGIAPGDKSALVAEFTQPDGKTLVTEGKGGGKVMWRGLLVTATVAKVSNKGVLTLDKDPRTSDGKTVHVEVAVPSHPELHAALDIPLRYDRTYKANFNGASGSNGSDGSSGMDGSMGSSGSMDPNNPSPGGNGGDGTNGGDGGSGGNGGDAPAVDVRVHLRAGSEPLLEVIVTSSKKTRYYLLDPKGGQLQVSANGGDGGRGGSGGRGGRGGSGGIGSPSGMSGHDGLSGHDGMSGSSGSGGKITVYYDPAAQPYLGVLKLSNVPGPKPQFVPSTVNKLW